MNLTVSRGRLAVLMALAFMSVAKGLHAQDAAKRFDLELQTPQRLSNWLGTHADALQGSEPLGLAWATPEERQRQTVQRNADVAWLRHALLRPDESVLWRWLASAPVTGRVVLPASVAPWLEGVPARDPVLRPGDGLWVAPAGQPVRVLDGSGHGCALAHQPGAWLADYLAECATQDANWPGRLWAVQPDGRVRAFNLQPWQPEPQTQLAPGAVLWMGWPRSLLKPDVNEAELEDINRRTALWLAMARPGEGPDMLPGLAQGVDAAQRVVPATAGTGADADWTGLRGARFTPVPSSSNWGVVGLMQTPTARMRPAGSFSLSWMKTWPDTWINVMLQPFDWLEGGFRYVSVSNRMYGAQDFSGDQAYKDKSFELKARVAREGDWTPELALGVRDLGGTGLFGGEYLVASKRWGRLDASLGLGWGYMGARGNWPNPLSSVLGQKFDTRQNNVGVGGTLSTSAYFRGRTAPFGGLEYQSPWGPVLKVEYNGNDYRHEPQDNNQPVRSPFNYGLVYRWAPGVDLHASWERGNKLGLGISLWTDLSGLNMPKVTDKPLPPVSLAYPQGRPDWNRTLADIETYTNWQVRQLVQDGNTLGVEVSHSQDTYVQPRLERVMRVVQRDAPADVQQVEVRHWAAGDVLAVDRMDRARWLQSLTEPPRTAQAEPVSLREWPEAHSLNKPDNPGGQGTVLQAREGKPWSLSPGLGFRQSLGGPDAFMLYKLSLTLNGELHLPMDWHLYGLAELRTLSNYNLFKFRGFGTGLPRVRTYLREYETQSLLTLPRLYAARTARLSDSVTGSVYGGLLESMYGGAGGELLYRPRGSALAVGVDANRVQQRDFDQKFSMRDYKANTGHVTAYWETPWQGLVAALSVGQYLAGDRGATLKLTRTFSNGATMGVFATKTNVSAEQFGEGSFNKGVFWSIPFDAFMTSSSRLRANFSWVPLTRDGGAMLARPFVLYNETAQLSPSATAMQPAPPKQRIPDDLP
mgnify:CR=1 FL=1